MIIRFAWGVVVLFGYSLLSAGQEPAIEPPAEKPPAAETSTVPAKPIAPDDRAADPFRASGAVAAPPTEAPPTSPGRSTSKPDRKQHRTSAVYMVEDSQTARIREQLEMPTTMDFVETPLSEVVQYLEDLHKIQIELDGKAMAEADIPSDCPISLNLQDLRLRSALDLLLRPLEMTYVVTDQVLLITTRDQAIELPSHRVYPVQDLVQISGKTANYLPLICMITHTIAPDTWDSAGGEGSIEPFRGTLVIGQTEAVHTMIADLLAQLRAPEVVDARDATPAEIAKPPVTKTAMGGMM